MTNDRPLHRLHRCPRGGSEYDDFVRSKLTWGRLYRATSYLKSALWTVPLVAIVLELHAGAHAPRARCAGCTGVSVGLEPAGATALYQTVITLTLSFLVFTFGSLLVAIQVAGGQLTPRIIATTLLRDNVVRYSVGLFVFTLVFAVTALNRQGASVHELVALVTGILGVACIADFLFLIDYAARLLRPVSVVAEIGDEGVAMIKSVYPEPATALPPEAAALHGRPGMPSREVEHRGTSEIVLAVDLSTLVALARAPRRHDRVRAAGRGFRRRGRAAVRPPRRRDGDRRPRGAVDGGLRPRTHARAGPDVRVPDHRRHRVEGAVAGDQRSDDRRARARPGASATASRWARRKLRGEVILDGSGQPRVIFRTPNWEDYVQVACSEIRACGAGNLQVARRMRAMLENLRRTLPEHRRAALETELDLLDRCDRGPFPVS